MVLVKEKLINIDNQVYVSVSVFCCVGIKACTNAQMDKEGTFASKKLYCEHCIESNEVGMQLVSTREKFDYLLGSVLLNLTAIEELTYKIESKQKPIDYIDRQEELSEELQNQVKMLQKLQQKYEEVEYIKKKMFSSLVKIYNKMNRNMNKTGNSNQ